MRVSKFCSESYPLLQRENGWQAALGGIAKSYLRPGQAGGLRARVWTRETPLGIRIALISASPQQLSFFLPGEPDGVWIALLLEGHAVLGNGNQELQLGPDEIAHGPMRGQATLRFDDDFRLLLVRFPRDALNIHLQLWRIATRLNTESGMSHILSAVLHAVAETVESLPEGQERAIESMLREFVIANLTERATTTSNGSHIGPQQAVLLQKAHQIMETRLSDPELTITQVCTELGISVRYLYKLSAITGEGFGHYVKRRRLERCRCDLGNPIYAHLSVSQICFRWGFNDAAHFSRVFRNQFGMPPSTWRKTVSSETRASEDRSPRFHDRPTASLRLSNLEAQRIAP